MLEETKLKLEMMSLEAIELELGRSWPEEVRSELEMILEEAIGLELEIISLEEVKLAIELDIVSMEGVGKFCNDEDDPTNDLVLEASGL